MHETQGPVQSGTVLEMCNSVGWVDDHARKLVSDGFMRGRAAPTTLVTDVRVVVHGDDFTFAETEVELNKVQSKMREWSNFKVRGMLGRAQGSART